MAKPVSLTQKKFFFGLLMIILLFAVLLLIFPGMYIIPKRILGHHARKFYPPTQEQIEKMKNQRDLCFVDADCVGMSDVYYKIGTTDCNFDVNTNNYYCDSNECLSTFIGCTEYDVGDNICVQNTCKFKSIKTIK